MLITKPNEQIGSLSKANIVCVYISTPKCVHIEIGFYRMAQTCWTNPNKGKN